VPIPAALALGGARGSAKGPPIAQARKTASCRCRPPSASASATKTLAGFWERLHAARRCLIAAAVSSCR